MFTKICKVVMWIGIVACFVLSIVFGTSVKGWEFLVMLGGWIATLVIFSCFGMFIEMAENIRESRELLETMSNAQPAPQTNEEVNEDNDDMWQCEKCKCFNEASSTFCIYCGTPKP